ncbi:MAG TPA: hypothetical protein VGB37_04545 [Candidatus Lokiarchaeia archaeon]
MNLINVPIGFMADLFSLQKINEELDMFYHGYFIFNNKIFNEECKELSDEKIMQEL